MIPGPFTAAYRRLLLHTEVNRLAFTPGLAFASTCKWRPLACDYHFTRMCCRLHTRVTAQALEIGPEEYALVSGSRLLKTQCSFFPYTLSPTRFKDTGFMRVG